MEQQILLDDRRGKPIEIALDMQVDSPGHCVLLGAGSALDVDRNVTQHSNNQGNLISY